MVRISDREVNRIQAAAEADVAGLDERLLRRGQSAEHFRIRLDALLASNRRRSRLPRAQRRENSGERTCPSLLPQGKCAGKITLN